MALKIEWRRPRNILILLIIAFVLSAMIVKAYIIEISADARNGLVVVFFFAIVSILAAKYLPGLKSKKLKDPNILECEKAVKAQWKKERGMKEEDEVSWQMGRAEKTYFDVINPTFAFIFSIKIGTAELKQIRIIADHNYTITEWTDNEDYIDMDDIWKGFNHGHPGSPTPTPLEIKYPLLSKSGIEVNVGTLPKKKEESDITSGNSEPPKSSVFKKK